MNVYLIGEVVGKYKTAQQFISFIVIIPLFIYKLLGGINGHIQVEIIIIQVVAAIVFMAIIKLLLNLE